MPSSTRWAPSVGRLLDRRRGARVLSGDREEVADSMLEQLPRDEIPHLTEMIVDHALKPGYAYADEFEIGLDLILDGLERPRDSWR